MLNTFLTAAATESELESILTDEAEQVTSIFTQLWDFIKSLLPSLGFAAIVLFFGIFAAKSLTKLIKRSLKRSNIDPTAASFLQSLISVLLYALVAIIVLSVLNVPMTSIITVLGTAGLAIGLALQDSLANVAGGFLIMFTKPLKVGDLVKFGDVTGTVKSVGILQTKLILGDRTIVCIPNGQVADSVIVNYSEQELRRLELEIGISYEDDADLAKKLISDLIAAHPLSVDAPEPLVRVGGFGDNAVILHVRAWTANDDYWELYYDLHEQIKAAFDQNGIHFPFPQMDVHLNQGSM